MLKSDFEFTQLGCYIGQVATPKSYGKGTTMGKFDLPMAQVLAKLETTWHPNHTIQANDLLERRIAFRTKLKYSNQCLTRNNFLAIEEQNMLCICDAMQTE